MKILKKTLLLSPIVMLLIFMACSKDDDVEPPVLGDAKQIISFVFLAVDNNVLSEDVVATIDETNKTINATVPYGTIITSLVPTLEISQNATVSPQGTQDFSSPISYEVIAEDGSTSVYDATVGITPNTESSILSFDFLASVNGISENVLGDIDEVNKTITLEVPLAADLSQLKPTLEISQDATINPQDHDDFSSPVTYTVTAQDGTETEYLVTVYYSQYEILVTLYNDNPSTRFSWDLTDLDVSNWEGVTTVNGRITQLALDSHNLKVLSPEIAYLGKLTDLILFSNDLLKIPPEINQLSNLTGLFLSSNRIFELPPEIGQLTNLRSLRLAGNKLTEIPPEIGQLVNLTNLWLQNNFLTKIPEELGQLTNLTELRLTGNDLGEMPEEVCDLATVHGTSIQLDNPGLCD